MKYLELAKKQKANVNPVKLLLFAHTKVGKTTAVSKLPNALIIDLENGTNYITGNILNVKQLSLQSGKKEYAILYEIAKEIEETNQIQKRKVFKFIVFDTITALQDIAENLALEMYKMSPIGKNYRGSNILELPQGGGYYWLRKAFTSLYGAFENLSDYLIFLGHIKLSSITKDGEELTARDIELSGKMKQIICADCDAIGYLFRDKKAPNKVIVSFKTNYLDLVTGARPQHLKDQEFVLTELENNNLKTYWEKIYIQN